jgi:hypothetical protein
LPSPRVSLSRLSLNRLPERQPMVHLHRGEETMTMDSPAKMDELKK